MASELDGLPVIATRKDEAIGSLQQMVSLVREALDRKVPVELLADRITAFFVPAVLAALTRYESAMRMTFLASIVYLPLLLTTFERRSDLPEHFFTILGKRGRWLARRFRRPAPTGAATTEAATPPRRVRCTSLRAAPASSTRRACAAKAA